MSAARSEHEVSEIIDGLSEQEVSQWPRRSLTWLVESMGLWLKCGQNQRGMLGH